MDQDNQKGENAIQQNNKQDEEESNEIKIDISKLPKGVTEQQVRDSLKGISLKPIKGEIRQEYIPVTRMVTEYKEEVYYEQVPRQVKITYSPENQTYTREDIKQNEVVVVEQNGENSTKKKKSSQKQKKSKNGENSTKKKKSSQKQKKSKKSKNLIQNGTTTPNQQEQSGQFVYKQIPYQPTQQKYSPVSIVTPTYQINNGNARQQSFTPISQPTYQNFGFSKAIQYMGSPAQQVNVQQQQQYVQNGNVVSHVGYWSPQSYVQAPQNVMYKKF